MRQESTGRTERELMRVHIRWMIRRDMPEVLAAENSSFEYAWAEEDFLRCLRQRNCIGMVAEQGEKVVGFMIYELHKAKLHILNFAVHPSCRRFRVGSQMVAKLISKLSSHRRTRITLGHERLHFFQALRQAHARRQFNARRQQQIAHRLLRKIKRADTAITRPLVRRRVALVVDRCKLAIWLRARARRPKCSNF